MCTISRCTVCLRPWFALGLPQDRQRTRRERCPEDLNEQAMGNCLYGLQRLTNSAQVHTLLSAITRKLKTSPPELLT